MGRDPWARPVGRDPWACERGERVSPRALSPSAKWRECEQRSALIFKLVVWSAEFGLWDDVFTNCGEHHGEESTM